MIHSTAPRPKLIASVAGFAIPCRGYPQQSGLPRNNGDASAGCSVRQVERQILVLQERGITWAAIAEAGHFESKIPEFGTGNAEVTAHSAEALEGCAACRRRFLLTGQRYGHWEYPDPGYCGDGVGECIHFADRIPVGIRYVGR